MDIYELNEIIKSNVNSFHKFIPGSNEIIIRCPYCGDSIKHINKGHFYIGESCNTFLYQCKRADCGATGVLSKRVLEDIGIFDLNLFAEITKMNNSNIYRSIKTTKSINKFNDYNFNMFKSYYPIKLNYLRSRLYNIEDIDLNKYRIIFSSDNFFETYGIKLNQFQQSIAKQLEQNAIGFLNSNGSNIVFRYISDEFKFRYFKMKLNDDVDIYTISNELDLMFVDKLIINICEGSFDCINIMNRLKKNNTNEIFVACNGGDYVSKIEYLAKQSGILNVEINIFRDSDHSVNKIINQFKHTVFKDCINIYSNSLAKDFSYNELFVVKDY